MSFAPYLGAILLVPSILFFATAAQAQDVELGPSLICDTKQQVERFIALYDGDTQTAISAVNTEAQDPTACGLVTAAYVRGPQLATARNKDTTFGIAQIPSPSAARIAFAHVKAEGAVLRDFEPI